LNSAAFTTFRNAAERGQGSPGGLGEGESGGELGTVHQNTITSVRGYGPGKVSTTGVDGKMVIWNVDNVGHGTSVLSGRMGGMHLR
jgi:actin related protein 2/3 complex, subunit 1A/1B